jgi:hypothetical protein
VRSSKTCSSPALEALFKSSISRFANVIPAYVMGFQNASGPRPSPVGIDLDLDRLSLLAPLVLHDTLPICAAGELAGTPGGRFLGRLAHLARIASTMARHHAETAHGNSCRGLDPQVAIFKLNLSSMIILRIALL